MPSGQTQSHRISDGFAVIKAKVKRLKGKVKFVQTNTIDHCKAFKKQNIPM
jgi:hypothetical protein